MTEDVDELRRIAAIKRVLAALDGMTYEDALTVLHTAQLKLPSVSVVRSNSHREEIDLDEEFIQQVADKVAHKLADDLATPKF